LIITPRLYRAAIAALCAISSTAVYAADAPKTAAPTPAATAAPSTAPASPPAPVSVHVAGKVLTTAGAPVPGAAVSVISYHMSADHKYSVSLLGELKSGPDGSFDFPAEIIWGVSAPTSVVVATRTAVGLARILPKRTDGAPMTATTLPNALAPMSVTVYPLTTIRIRLVDSGDSPVAHVQVFPKFFVKDGSYGQWDHTIDKRWTAETGDDGWATIAGLPQGHTMTVDVGDDRFAQLGADARFELAKALTSPDRTIHLANGQTVSGMVTYEKTNAPVTGAYVNIRSTDYTMNAQAAADKDGHYTLARVRPGAYLVGAYMGVPGVDEWVAQPTQVTVEAGKDVSGVNVTFTHGGLIVGTVTDNTDGKPLKGVQISVQAGAVSQFYAASQADGTYRLRVLPGKYPLNVYSEGSTESVPQQMVEVADGQTKTLDLKAYAPLLAHPVSGVVLGPSGKPVARATITPLTTNYRSGTVITDDHGRFTIDNPGLHTGDRIYAKAGKLGTTMSAVVADQGDITIRLSPKALCPVKGLVNDAEGNPIANSKVSLVLWTADHGGTDVDTTQTDAAGRYSFPDAYADADYSVSSRPVGFAYAYSEKFYTYAGEAVAVPPIVAMRADSFVAGIVVDHKGNPVEGAEVSLSQVLDHKATTDKQGHFRVEGATRGKAIIQVHASQNRWASIEVTSGVDTNVITVRSNEEQGQ
jgi:protocatechuate 3,4-dioxygenase beta subunit